MATKKTTSSKKSTVKTSPSQNTESKNSLSRVKLRNLIIVLVVILVIAGLYLLRGQLIAATVNGQPVSRFELISQLEKQNGQAVLDNIIIEKVIAQEAKSKNITVSQKEIDEEIKNIETNLTQQGQDLNTILASRNLTRNDLKTQVQTQLLINKLIGKITITDKEVNDYIEQNKDSIPEGTDPESLKPQVKAQLEQEKISTKTNELLSKLKEKSKIEYLIKF